MDKVTLSDKIKEVTELLYQQKIQQGYQQLNGLLGDISAYVSTIEEEERQQAILEVLTEALAAMEQQDTTLLADLLQYELLDNL